MRILSPTPDLTAQAPFQNTVAKKVDPMVDETAESTTTSSTPLNSTSKPTVPTVVLDTDAVSHHMAARLCISFLGHVLFLKNQVPFPIVQLARMSTNDDTNTTRAAKKRGELLDSFDTLASHLYTTFVALSTALALRGVPETTEVALRNRVKDGVATAFFACALGPTVGTAKSRVIVGINGLQTRVWGLRNDDILDKATRTRSASGEDDADNNVESASDTDEEDEHEQIDGQESEGSSDEEEVSGSDEGASPPPSRSPSPSLSSDSDPPPPEDPEVVRAAERLLSRTLASACAEDDGQGLASDMAPTQIHVLLRAPRRFDHPSWMPRQNLRASLDSYLADFLVESGQVPGSGDIKSRKRTKASKVQGVWIKSRGNSARMEDSEEDLAEQDELIWWSWDGRLAGFADW